MTVLVLYLILSAFLQKIHKLYGSQGQPGQGIFENADRVNAMAEEKLQAYNQKLAEIEAEGQTSSEARKKADMQAKQILEDANKRANEMIRQAEEEIEKKQLQAIVEMKSQIAELAMLAAEKVWSSSLMFTDRMRWWIRL